MFVLRKITEEGKEMVFNLGDDYTLLTEEETPEIVQALLEEMKKETSHTDDVYGFIKIGDSGKKLPLWSRHQNYIMTESGQTFANISQKKVS